MKDEAFVRLFAGSGRRALENGLELCVVPANRAERQWTRAGRTSRRLGSG